ncbi:MAG: hypothetical protein B7Y39_10085 [Bdellovibrio sp. 28-41-41]|nr:MAG: hypothetical protein B7Y39_10085 [Bdellovibrio sp. 28-41-41]
MTADVPLSLETQLINQNLGLYFRNDLDVERRLQWTKSVFSDVEFTWRPDWGGERDTEYEISLMYGPAWNWAAGLMLTENSTGVGAQIQF